MQFIAYKVMCLPTDKVYIGITIQPLRKRWQQHVGARFSSQTKMARALAKYGPDKFSVQHIASATSREALLDLEILLIRQENSQKHGLNSTSGGDGVRDFEHNEASRAKMRESQKLIGLRPETIARRSEAAKKAWLQRTEQQVKEHRERASRTIREYLKTAPKRTKKAKEPKPFLGKGYNMKIKTHCPQGHAYEGENLWIDAKGRRNCRICKRASRNVARDVRRAKNRAAAGGKAY